MSLVNNSANNFKDFLDAIKPYLNYQFYDLSGQGVEANNFSTDEKVIGTWIDGKPLYQKVITNTTNADSSGTKVIETISNIDTGFITEAYVETNVINGLGRCWGNIDSSKSVGDLYINPSNGQVIFYTTNSNYFNKPIVVTLRYTKTTDTAVASGEKIVGQWIDGKPVYEKTVSCGTLPNNTTKTVAHGISNLDGVKTVFGYGYRSSDDTSIFFPDNSLLAVWIKGDDIYLSDTADRSSYTESYVTLRYTKTTD